MTPVLQRLRVVCKSVIAKIDASNGTNDKLLEKQCFKMIANARSNKNDVAELADILKVVLEESNPGYMEQLERQLKRSQRNN